MKIIFTADVHWDYGYQSSEIWLPYIDEICDRKPDIFVIGGDISGRTGSFLDALQVFSKIPCRKYIVLGNHDVWLLNDGYKDSNVKYECLCNLIGEYGFHSLDKAPDIVNRFGLIGNIGWYDYSFRDKEVDIFYPLAMNSYREKKFPNNRVTWGDGRFVRWNESDENISMRFAEKLLKDIALIEDKVDSILYFSHHIPLEGMIKKGSIEWNMGNAFSGSKLFENLVFNHDKIKYVFCGHSHTIFEGEIENRYCINVGSDYLKPRYKEVVI